MIKPFETRNEWAQDCSRDNQQPWVFPRLSWRKFDCRLHFAGCVFAELATGRALFPGKSSADQLHLILQCFGAAMPLKHLQLASNDERLRFLRMPAAGHVVALEKRCVLLTRVQECSKRFLGSILTVCVHRTSYFEGPNGCGCKACGWASNFVYIFSGLQ